MMDKRAIQALLIKIKRILVANREGRLMNKTVEFFTETPSDLGFMYIIFLLSTFTYIIFRFLPEEKSKRFFLGGRLFDWNKYDYHKTIKKNITFARILCMFSSIILVLTFVIGDVVAYVGVRVFFPLVFVLVIVRGNPVKKQN